MNSVLKSGLIRLRAQPSYPALQSRAKSLLIEISLRALGAAFEVMSRRIPSLQAELATWNDGRRFAIGILPRGPSITLENRGGRIHFLGKGLQSPDVAFLFKNLDAGVRVFSGLMSTHQAVAEVRVLIRGNNSHAMEANRAMGIVMTYLFPGFMFKMLFKDPPRLDAAQKLLKLRIYLALLPALLRQLW